jgi:hypothetical protein
MIGQFRIKSNFSRAYASQGDDLRKFQAEDLANYG